MNEKEFVKKWKITNDSIWFYKQCLKNLKDKEELVLIKTHDNLFGTTDDINNINQNEHIIEQIESYGRSLKKFNNKFSLLMNKLKKEITNLKELKAEKRLNGYTV